MSLYSPASAPSDLGLSAAAQELSSERLEAEVLVAEAVLGLNGTSYEDDQATVAMVAVARQVNLQLRLADQDSDVISESRGTQSVTYATVSGQRVPVDRVALASVRALQPKIGSGAVQNRIVW